MTTTSSTIRGTAMTAKPCSAKVTRTRTRTVWRPSPTGAVVHESNRRASQRQAVRRRRFRSSSRIVRRITRRRVGHDRSNASWRPGDDCVCARLLPPPPPPFSQLNELIESLDARGAADAMAIVERLCKCHAIALAAQNKQAIHLLYDALLERFVRLGDYVYGGASHGWQRRGGGALVAREPLAATDGARAQIDGLTRVLFDLSATMPEAAAALWRRRIVAIQAKVAAAVRAPTDSESGGGAWPSAGSLLALKLLSTLFPTSDARHGVTTPAALLVGQCLRSAPSLRHDLVRGLFCTGLALTTRMRAGRGGLSLCPRPSPSSSRRSCCLRSFGRRHAGAVAHQPSRHAPRTWRYRRSHPRRWPGSVPLRLCGARRLTARLPRLLLSPRRVARPMMTRSLRRPCSRARVR